MIPLPIAVRAVTLPNDDNTFDIYVNKNLDTRYAHWFRSVSQPELAKAEILKYFSEEPEPYEWTEQDIWEQSRKILTKWSRN